MRRQTLSVKPAVSGDPDSGAGRAVDPSRGMTSREPFHDRETSPVIIRLAVVLDPGGTVRIDPPVSGAPRAAGAALLLIVAGCHAHAVTVLAPGFDAPGKRTIWLGRTGAGAVN